MPPSVTPTTSVEAAKPIVAICAAHERSSTWLVTNSQHCEELQNTFVTQNIILLHLIKLVLQTLGKLSRKAPSALLTQPARLWHWKHLTPVSPFSQERQHKCFQEDRRQQLFKPSQNARFLSGVPIEPSLAAHLGLLAAQLALNLLKL